MEEELEDQKEDIRIKLFSSGHPLNNIEVTNYFNYEHIFNSVFSRNNLPRTKAGGYLINHVDKDSKRTHCVSFFIDRNATVYFHSFGVEYIPIVLNKIRDKSITDKIFRIQDRIYAFRSSFVRLYQFCFLQMTIKRMTI